MKMPVASLISDVMVEVSLVQTEMSELRNEVTRSDIEWILEAWSLFEK